MKASIETCPDDCIRTHSGLYMNVFDPTPDMICIEDIAHALGMMPRFGGHLPVFYSVAQHSTSTALLVEPQHRLAALLHDASEAYLMDIPRPIKSRLSNYKEIENKLMEVIARKFNFEWPLPPEVKMADEAMLQFEWNEIMMRGEFGTQITILSPAEAKIRFIERFNLYTKAA